MSGLVGQVINQVLYGYSRGPVQPESGGWPDKLTIGGAHEYVDFVCLKTEAKQSWMVYWDTTWRYGGLAFEQWSADRNPREVFIPGTEVNLYDMTEQWHSLVGEALIASELVWFADDYEPNKFPGLVTLETASSAAFICAGDTAVSRLLMPSQNMMVFFDRKLYETILTNYQRLPAER